jgi:hypothetical protein
MGMYLISVHLPGVHLTGVHLMGVHLVDVYFMDVDVGLRAVATVAVNIDVNPRDKLFVGIGVE